MKIFSYLTHHKVVMGILLAIVVVATAVMSRLDNGAGGSAGNDSLPKVHLASVKDYQQNRVGVSANGTVESLQQAELKSQVMAPVSKINVAIGDKVSPGQVLVTLQNADMAAQLAQTQALLKTQEARLDEMRKGIRSEELDLIETKVAAARQTLENTKQTQDVMVESALKAKLNAGLMAEPSGTNAPGTVATVSGTYTGKAEGQYKISLYATGGGWRFQYSGLESGDGLVSTSPVPLGTRGLFLKFSDTAISAPSNTWTVNIPNTQSPMYVQASSGYEAAVEGRKAAIDGATSALTAAEQELTLRKAGATSEQLKAQEAAVEQAQASVQAVAAQYAKTVIRSPISGTVSSINVKYGELLTMGQPVVSIVNEGGLQIKAFISDFDLPQVEEGAEVTIGESVKGVVSRVSPSVDPLTKNVEVNILVSEPEKSGLIVGQTVPVKIAAKQATETSAYLLPLQAVNVGNEGAFVFTVRDDGTLEAVKVELGEVKGELVEVVRGLDSGMNIVSTVYELKAGQKVKTQ